jgi:acetolactate synthase I/II/III large subunit
MAYSQSAWITRGPEVGVYKGTFGKGSIATSVHWSKDVRFDKIAESFGYIDREQDIGPAIQRAFTGGKPRVVHVPIDPNVNSQKMSNYNELRT